MVGASEAFSHVSAMMIMSSSRLRSTGIRDLPRRPAFVGDLTKLLWKSRLTALVWASNSATMAEMLESGRPNRLWPHDLGQVPSEIL